MGKGCKAFTQGQDQMGKQVQFNYKRGPKYGTTTGGICSVLARCLILIIAAFEIYSNFSSPVVIESSKYS